MNSYRAPFLFSNPHVNTIFAARVARAPRVDYRRERWDTPDGDFIDVDFVDGPRDAPCVLLFHGLEGSSNSRYARELMAAVHARRWRGVVPNWRGCSGEPNRKARAYHSGDSSEADFILRKIAARLDGAPLHVAGVSLGGNVLCKWLGEQGDDARIVRSAISICAPIDLAACAAALEQGFTRVYAAAFLRTLRKAALARLARFPGIYDEAKLRAAKTLRAFDDVVTAPLHGYVDADDYYRRGSAAPLLRGVRQPLLLVNPVDDPFFPVAAWPAQESFATSIVVDRPAQGGHVGFSQLGRESWIAKRVLAFADANS